MATPLSNSVYTLSCPDGPIQFTGEQLVNNPFIKGTAIEMYFFPKNEPTRLIPMTLTWGKSVVQHLIPLIREGVIKEENLENKSEFMKLIAHLAGDNPVWWNIAKSLQTSLHDFTDLSSQSRFPTNNTIRAKL